MVLLTAIAATWTLSFKYSFIIELYKDNFEDVIGNVLSLGAVLVRLIECAYLKCTSLPGRSTPLRLELGRDARNDVPSEFEYPESGLLRLQLSLLHCPDQWCWCSSSTDEQSFHTPYFDPRLLYGFTEKEKRAKVLSQDRESETSRPTDSSLRISQRMSLAIAARGMGSY